MSQKQVRKRGPNYTPEEKSLLLDLVMQFKDIVENKKTGSIYIQKKKEAWNAITTKYNSNCRSGPRDTEQLKALYDNMKQKSRKDVGETNKLAYIHSEQNVLEDDLEEALKIAKEDKIGMQKTGGGLWKPKMTSNDAKILAIIEDQVKPLSNPYDSASGFFKEAVVLDINVIGENEMINVSSPSCVPNEEVAKKDLTPAQEWLLTPKNYAIPKSRKVNKRKASKQGKIIKSTSAETLKRLYFKKKCQIADLERKKLMMEILHQKKEHNLRLEILKNKVKNLNMK